MISKDKRECVSYTLASIYVLILVLMQIQISLGGLAGRGEKTQTSAPSSSPGTVTL